MQLLPETTTALQFTITTKLDEDSFVVTLNGTQVATTNYDNKGWMEPADIEQIINNIAQVIGATVAHCVATQ